MNAVDDVAVLLLLLGASLLLAGTLFLFRYGRGLGEGLFRLNKWMQKAGLAIVPVALALLLLAWLVNGEIDVS